VSFSGEINNLTDPDLTAAGSTGNVFDILNSTSEAIMSFSFDVSSISFIFGGNSGIFDIAARDILGNIVDSFYTNTTGNGAFAGPVTLSGAGIRSLYWTDPGFNFAAIDNVSITVASVPAPASLALILLGLAGIGFSRKKKTS